MQRNNPATETIEPVSMDRLFSELTKQRNSIREDICGLIQEFIGPLQSSTDALRETVDDFQGRLVSMETRVGENFENLIAAEMLSKICKPKTRPCLTASKTWKTDPADPT